MLGKKSVYALHALLHLAKQKEGAPVGVAALALHIGCSKKFLEHIMAALKEAGCVQAISGRNGGYLLSQSPEKMSVADVVRLFEGPIALKPCASHRFFTPCPECASPDLCGLRDGLTEARNAMVDTLKSLTLFNLVARENNLREGTKNLSLPTPYRRTFAKKL